MQTGLGDDALKWFQFCDFRPDLQNHEDFVLHNIWPKTILIDLSHTANVYRELHGLCREIGVHSGRRY